MSIFTPLPWFLINIVVIHAQVLPIHYNISLAPNLDSLSFSGRLAIEMLVENQNLSELVLDSKNLQVDTVVDVVNFRGGSQRGSVNVVEGVEVLRVVFEEPLDKGLYALSLNYTGPIGDKGFYSTSDRLAAFANLKLDRAKEVFPCLQSIAVFSLTVTVPVDMTVVANTPDKSHDIRDSRSTFEFSTTDPMFPTSLSFAILNATAWRKLSNVLYPSVQLYTVPQQSTYHSFVLQLCNEVLDTFAQLYGLAQTTVTIVLVQDIAEFEGSEHPGLVLLKEEDVRFAGADSELLLQDRLMLYRVLIRTMIVQRVQVERTWYYPALVQWYQLEVLDGFFPSLGLQGRLEDLHATLRTDAKVSLIEFSDDVSELHRSKAYWTFRMLANFLVLHPDISEPTTDSIAYQWIHQTGYPILTVDVNITSNQITLSQSCNNPWKIPVNFATRSDPNFNDARITHMLNSCSATYAVASFEVGDWLLANKQQYGYYRVNYNDANWNRLATVLNDNDFQTIHPVNRAQLLDDSLNLAEVGLTNYANYLNLLPYLDKEMDVAPLLAYYTTFNRLKLLLTLHSATYHKLLTYTDGITGHLYRKFAINTSGNMTESERLLRIKTLSFLAGIGHKLVLFTLNQLLISGDDSVDKDLMEAAFCGGVKLATEVQYEQVLRRYESSGSLTVLKGAACATDPDLLRKLFDLIARSKTHHSYPVLLTAIEEGIEGTNATLTYIRNNMEQFTRFTAEEISTILVALSRNSIQQHQRNIINEIIEYLNDTNQKIHVKVVEQIGRNIEANLEWAGHYLELIDDFLTERISTSPSGESSSTSPVPTPPSSAMNYVSNKMFFMCSLLLPMSLFHH